MTEIISNATSAMSLFISYSAIGWLVTLAIFLGIVFALFIVFKNFKRICYGAVITGILIIIYISRWIGISTQERNYVPLQWFGYILGFIILSWIKIMICTMLINQPILMFPILYKKEYTIEK